VSQHPQQVAERGHAPHGRARGGRAPLLLQGHGGRNAVDLVDVGDAHLVEQPPRVRRHRAAAGKPALKRLVTRMSPAHEKAGVSNHSFNTPACGVAVRAEGGGPRDYQWSS
jgi:hypothetical protein